MCFLLIIFLNQTQNPLFMSHLCVTSYSIQLHPVFVFSYQIYMWHHICLLFSLFNITTSTHILGYTIYTYSYITGSVVSESSSIQTNSVLAPLSTYITHDLPKLIPLKLTISRMLAIQHLLIDNQIFKISHETGLILPTEVEH